MESKSSEDKNDYKGNKQLIHHMCSRDGHMVSPIDLALDSTVSINLEPLKWVHPEEAPVKMKLTNSGDTLVISGKWNKERPYLTGGPLDGNYVFSQVHFHWGSTEHEGSEHTVKGVCYPLEMHVVFFKTRYLTQASALKQDDGIVIVAYLFKLQTRSCTGIQWLTSQLSQVTEPKTSSEVTSVPLSSIMVPFSADYLTYWGALVSNTCQHPVLWLVSRAALGITSDNLKMFRNLLNSNKESISKNFRTTNAPMSRTVFHVNPSEDTKQLLYKGAVDPPCQMIIVNHVQTPQLEENEAKKIFSKGDSSDLNADHKLSDLERLKLREERIKAKSTNKRLRCLGKTSPERNVLSANPEVKSSSRTNSIISDNSSKDESPLPRHKRKLPNETKFRKQSALSKNLSENEENRTKNNESFLHKGDCLHVDISSSIMSGSIDSEGSVKKNQNNMKTDKGAKKGPEIANNKIKPPMKSKLPMPIGRNKITNVTLQSSYAEYFKRPESAPMNNTMKSPLSVAKPLTPNPTPQNCVVRSTISARNKKPSTIPKTSIKIVTTDTPSVTIKNDKVDTPSVTIKSDKADTPPVTIKSTKMDTPSVTSPPAVKTPGLTLRKKPINTFTKTSPKKQILTQ